MKRKFIIYLLSLTVYSCQTKTKENIDPLFKLLDSRKTGVSFINEVKESKDFNILTYRNFYNGGGVAIGDINNDGLPDLYFTANQLPNRLYLNKGNLQFEDITEISGTAGTKPWSTGANMVDINADGFLDIYVSNSGDVNGSNKENELFINNGNGTFTEKAEAFNLNNAGYGTHAAFFDFDADGDLDCYILNNSFKEPGKIELYRSMRETPNELGGDKLMRNDGQKFTDVTQEAGIYSSEIGFGLGVATGDLNGDMLPDLYISNDFWERDYLYLNNGDGTFTEDLNNRINYCSVSSMGADISDINGDGTPEIFTTDMLPADNYRIKTMTSFEPYHLEDLKYRSNYHYQMIQNCLHLNDGQGNFQEIALLSGVSASDWSWGALLFDFQNDGRKDLFVSNGIHKDIISGDFREFLGEAETQELVKSGKADKDLTVLTKHIPSSPQANFAFIQDSDLRFKNEADKLGLATVSFSNGSAYADLDNDGDLDLVLNNVNMPCFIYENMSNEKLNNNYLKIRLKGPSGNLNGIGAKAIIETNDQTLVLENFTNRGFESSIEPSLLFGLGKIESIDKLKIIWPDKKQETITEVPVNQTLDIDYQNAKGYFKGINYEGKKWFTETTSKSFKTNIKHTENSYNDFNTEPLLHQMLSTEGPRIITGDINDDGLEDLLLLGAKDDPDKLFIQNQNKSFNRVNASVFDNDKNFESSCGAFLDYDNDGDLDLLIGAGGNQIDVEQINFIVRLYLNDGKGNFQVDPEHIPPCVGNFSTLEVSDFDNDGDPDFFLGGRAVAGNYGLIPESYLFRNDNGHWKNVSSEGLSHIGMVTDATWADIDQDNDDDLIVIGDWMGVNIIVNSNGVFNEIKELPNSKGWWQRIEASDLDNDGDLDFVLGNWGQNSKFRASFESPVTMNVHDFDGNGKTEFIINWVPPAETTLYPFATKTEITSQMPSLKKKNLKYDAFAKMKVDDFVNLEDFQKSLEYKIENLNTGVLWNNIGDLRFQELPIEAQVSPVFGIIAEDLNKDGIKDLWLGGNFYGLKPQVGRHDASRGVLLKGMKNGQYTPVSNEESGIYIKGQVRDAVTINNQVIIARNNENLKVYSTQ